MTSQDIQSFLEFTLLLVNVDKRAWFLQNKFLFIAKMQSMKRVLPNLKTLMNYQRCLSNKTTSVTKEILENERVARVKQTAGLEYFQDLVSNLNPEIKRGEESQPQHEKSMLLHNPALFRSVTQDILNDTEEETVRATTTFPQKLKEMEEPQVEVKTVSSGELNKTTIVEKNDVTQSNVAPSRLNEDNESVDLTELDEDLPRDVTEKLRSKRKDVAVHLQSSFNPKTNDNRSETLKKFVKMGVQLSNWDECGSEIKEFILRADFEKVLKPCIQFLHDQGIQPDDFGRFLTKNPFIFLQDLDDMQIRIKNLESKNFQKAIIAKMIVKAPFLLNLDTAKVDGRIAYLQKEFQLTEKDLRSILSRQPKLLTWQFSKLRSVQFSMTEEFGFSPNQTKLMLLNKPKLWLSSVDALKRRFHLIHKKMGVSHEQLSIFPEGLLCRQFITRQRHLFLKSINRDQYDPEKENYVTLKALVKESDENFCSKVAKVPMSTFKYFVKTL